MGQLSILTRYRRNSCATTLLLYSVLMTASFAPVFSLAQSSLINPHPMPIQHIEVTIGSPLNGRQELSRNNFIVTVQGRRYQIKLIQPSTKIHPAAKNIDTHLLLFIPESAAKLLANARLSAQLKPLLARGWQISIFQSGGHATPYLTTSAALQSAIAAPSAISRTPDTILNELLGFPGRRVLLIAGGTDSIESQWFESAKPFLSPIYVVDAASGPDTAQNIADNLACLANHGSAPCASYQDDTPRVYNDGIAYEKSINVALKDVLLDTRNFYDLSFTPDSPITDSIVLTLRRFAPTQFVVDTYSENITSTSNVPNIAHRTHDNLVVEKR
jgi:hypothetical protein